MHGNLWGEPFHTGEPSIASGTRPRMGCPDPFAVAGWGDFRPWFDVFDRRRRYGHLQRIYSS